MELAQVQNQLATNGFAWIRSAIDVEACDQFKALLGQIPVEKRRGGVRHIDREVAEIRRLAVAGLLARLVSDLLSPEAHLLRSIWFNKTEQQNWLVTWHQDITVSAQSRFDLPGWVAWSEKEGVLHVQPPESVLLKMLTFRLHLDAATLDNGALKVVPGSHTAGVQRSGIHIDESKVEVCEAEVGDILIMSPLLWHSSSKAINPSSRQILHFEYAHHELAGQLGWHPLEKE